jgi:UDP-glucuronate decarboxylase
MGTSESFTGPVNLGNPDEFTIRQLAELVIELTNSNSKLVNKPLPPDDPQQRQPDITLAKAELDWAPVTPLRDGLVKTVSYFEQLISDGLA